MKLGYLIKLTSTFLLTASVACSTHAAITGNASSMKPSTTQIPATYYSGQSTDTTAVVSYDYYTKFPQCQLSPYGYTTKDLTDPTKTATLPAYNPDINKKMPAPPTGATANTIQYTYFNSKLQAPPPQCWVKSRVTCNGGNACKLTTDTIDTNPPPIAAVCPDGYVQVGAFDMQPEIVNNPTTITKTSPNEIPDMKTYNYLVLLGYSCTVVNYDRTMLSPCSAAPAVENNTYTFDYARKIGYPNPAKDSNNNPMPGVVMFNDIQVLDRNSGNNQCWTTVTHRNCSGGVDSLCRLGTNSGYPSYGATASSISTYLASGAVDYYVKYGFTYGHVTCTLTSGLRFKNTMAPRSIMCARIQSDWKKVN